VKSKIIKNIIIIIILLFFIFFGLTVKDPFFQHIMIISFLFILVGEAWNIIYGYAGQMSFCNNVFFGIGAYVSAILLISLKLPVLLSIWIGGILSAILSLCIGYPCFKLRGPYFGMATIALAEMIYTLALARGLGSFISIPTISPSWLYLQWPGEKTSYFFLFLSFAVFSVFLVYILEKTNFFLFLRAIKEDEDKAESLGIDVLKYKLHAFAISAFLSAIGGSLYAQYVLYIDPRSLFAFDITIRIMIGPIIGGVGTVIGPIIGTFTMMPTSELFRAYFGGGIPGLDLVLYGLIMVVITLYCPGGIVNYLTRWRRKFVRS
jgi:branched-chain amino acid transport system permease protein